MSSVRSGVAWMAAAQGGLFVLQFVVSILVARLLGPYEMGIFAVALSIAGMLSIFRSVGLGAYVIRSAEVTKPLLTTVFTVNAVLAIVVALAIAGLGLLGSAVLEEDGVRYLLLVMAVLPLIGILDFLPSTAIERRGDFRAVASVNVIRYGIASLATLGLAYAGHGYMSLGYGQLISAVIAAVLNNVLGREWASLRPGFREWRVVARFGTQMFALSAIGGLQGRLTELLLAKLLDLAALGVFSRASGLTGVLWENVQLVVLRVLFVDLAEQKREGRSLRHAYLRLSQVLTATLWPAFIGMAAVAGPLVIALFGEAWSDVIVPLQLLSVSSALFVLIMANHNIFVICGETALRMRIEMVRAPASLALFAVGCLISLPAAAGMKVVEAFLMGILYRPHMERMTDTRWTDSSAIYGQSLLLTAAAVLPVAAVMTVHGWSSHAPLPAVLAGVGLGVFAWVLALRVTRHPLFDEARRLLRRLRLPRAAVPGSPAPRTSP